MKSRTIALATACLASSAAAQSFDNLPTNPATSAALGWKVTPRETPFDWTLKAEYVGAGDIDAVDDAPLVENKTSLAGSVSYALALGKAAVLTPSAGLSVADDYTVDNKNGSAAEVGLSLKAAAPIAGWTPTLSVAAADNRLRLFGDHDRSDVTGSVSATRTIPLRSRCGWTTADKTCLKLTVTPTLSRVESSDDSNERNNLRLDASISGITAFGVTLVAEGRVERREYLHTLTGADYERNDNRIEGYLGANARDLARTILTDVDLSTLSDLWVGARWVNQDSNSYDPKYSYSRVQFVITLKFGGKVYVPDFGSASR